MTGPLREAPSLAATDGGEIESVLVTPGQTFSSNHHQVNVGVGAPDPEPDIPTALEKIGSDVLRLSERSADAAQRADVIDRAALMRAAVHLWDAGEEFFRIAASLRKR